MTRRPRQLAHGGVLANDIRSLAVLPLANLSGDASQDYLAEGLTDALIGHLSSIHSLRVTSRTSVTALHREHHSLPEIAGLLGVDAVVEGSVVKEGSRVRISAKLLDAHTERLIWSDTHDSEIESVLVLQADVARSVAEGLRSELTGSEAARLAATPRIDPAAYESCLRGRLLLANQGEARWRRAITCFDAATEIDPTYAPAWSGLADAYYLMSGLYLPAKDAIPRSRAAALRALALDPDLAEAHVSLGTVLGQYDRNWVDALESLRRAIELQPSSAQAHLLLAIVLAETGALDEAEPEYARARELDPLSDYMASLWCQPAYLLGRHDEIIAASNDWARASPESFGPHTMRGLCYAQLGRHAEAVVELRTAVTLVDTQVTQAWLAMALALAGHADEARAIAERLRHGGGRPVSAYGQAIIAAALGEPDRAFEWLETGWRNHDEDMNMIKVDPHLRSLAEDTRFADLLIRMNLAP